jgi:FkbM family methyltransferase
MTETLTFRRRSAVGEIQKNDDCVILHCHCYFTFQIHINSSSYIHTRFLIAPLLLASSTIARTFRSISVPGLPLPALRQPAYLSQCGQDYVLQRLFKNATGLFYVDLAAHDPAYLSSTYFLDRVLHWRGLCIEGNYQHFYALLAERTCDVVGAAVAGADAAPTAQFHLSSMAALSGIAGLSPHNPVSSGNLVTVPTSTLQDILEQANAPHTIDFLSLDVEGAEWLAMKDFDFKRFSFLVVIVERPQENLRNLLRAHRYQFVGLLSNAAHGEELWLLESFVKVVEQRDGKNALNPVSKLLQGYTGEQCFHQ